MSGAYNQLIMPGVQSSRIGTMAEYNYGSWFCNNGWDILKIDLGTH